jgi:hypothetical protein
MNLASIRKESRPHNMGLAKVGHLCLIEDLYFLLAFVLNLNISTF